MTKDEWILNARHLLKELKFYHNGYLDDAYYICCGCDLAWPMVQHHSKDCQIELLLECDIVDQ